ncbi:MULTISPECIES: RND family transporter [Halorhodospira]|uniref:efflux RND transporter permease subunit n=1 Tax=Halorhodospira TaxID=85108 RepID=UPI001EE95EF9|nr:MULTISPECIES: MMPL family transporter [Halorhodospira]MCG5528038.1 MMPL family transporter [Halorhodospira halophila]MCG5542092.1 MMPL family transporter [Halorhodospira sp. 9628]
MQWMLQRPRLALILLALLVLLPSPLLLQLQIDNAPESYFPEEAPAVVTDQQVRDIFPQEQLLVALFEGDDLFEADFLSRLHALVEDLEAAPTVERVLAPTTNDHIRATVDGFAVERLIRVNELDERTAEHWRERVTGDTFAPGFLVAEDGSALAILARPHALEDSLQRVELEQRMRAGISEHGLEPQLTAIGGHIALDVAQLQSMINDLMLLVPGTLGIGLLLLWFLFRRILVLILAAATISAVTGATMGLLVLLGKPFTLITAIVPPLLTALTVAMLMHFFNAVLHHARRGAVGPDRVRAALRDVARPTLFMALTTAVGLASLTVSPIRPIESFGLIAAFGVVFGALCVLFLIPALVLRFDRGPWVRRRGAMAGLDRFTATTARWAVRRPGTILAVSALIVIVSIPMIRQVEVETDLYEFFADDHPLTQATQRIEGKLSGVMPLEVIFKGPDMDSLLDPGRLEAMAQVQEWLDERPEVDYSLSLPDLVAEMHWAFHEEDPDYRRIPDNEALIAQYLFIHDGRDLFDVVDRDYSQARLMLNLNATGARELNTLIDDLRDHLAAEPPADLEWDLTGMGRLFADQERLLIQGQLHSLVVVVIAIFVLMLMMWRSATVAAASMVPNLAPILLIFGLMGLLGIWLDTATAMIASVAVGIAIDDTIHFLHAYRSRRARGASTVWAIARASRQAGRAITATTIILVGQFLLVGASDFQPTQAFGLLTAFGLVVALLVDLLVLPALLAATQRTQRLRG